MKIIVGHNHYQQPGGEDAVAKAEVEILRQRGHDVLYVEFNNKDFNDLSAFGKAQNILSWGWSKKAYDLFLQHCSDFKPDVAHFHNTFYMMTPSVYSACQRKGVPVIQTLHNFRLKCSNGLFFRQGHVCEECQSHSLDKAVQYGCYRDSRILSWAVVNMLKKHWKEGTWHQKIDLFIALTDFAKNKFIEIGLPSEKVVVKPNFITYDPGSREGIGDYFVFAGRLTEEKGIKVLIEAFRNLPNEKLVVMGDGPLKGHCENYIKEHGLENIRLLGHLGKQEYFDALKKARALIVPSLWYENFPVVILEAFACGIPVIASQLGSLKEIIVENKTGLLFNTGHYQDLIEKVNTLNNNNLGMMAWGKEARKQYENKYSAQINYEKLITFYQHLKESKR